MSKVLELKQLDLEERNNELEYDLNEAKEEARYWHEEYDKLRQEYEKQIATLGALAGTNCDSCRVSDSIASVLPIQRRRSEK